MSGYQLVTPVSCSAQPPATLPHALSGTSAPLTLTGENYLGLGTFNSEECTCDVSAC